MKKRYFALAIVLLAAPVYLLTGHAAKEAPSKDVASEAVREMAGFLETAPAGTVRQLAGSQGSAPSPAREAAQNATENAKDATESGVSRVEENERRIAAHYPQTEAGALIRHYVALVLSEVDTDFRPELSRMRAMNDLMQDAGVAATELQTSLSSLPTESGSEAERAALLKLAAHVGSNEAALPAVENMLASEISRHSGLDSNENEARLVQLVDSYTMLIADPRKQADFVRTGIQSQDDARLKQALETYLDNLNSRTNLTQAQVDAAGAG